MNLQVVPVKSEEQVQNLLKLAQQHRAVASTTLNERSSRSHSIFQLKLIGENMKTTETCEGKVFPQEIVYIVCMYVLYCSTCSNVDLRLQYWL